MHIAVNNHGGGVSALADSSSTSTNHLMSLCTRWIFTYPSARSMDRTFEMVLMCGLCLNAMASATQWLPKGSPLLPTALIASSTLSMVCLLRQRLSRVLLNICHHPSVFTPCTTIVDDTHLPLTDEPAKVHGQRLNARCVGVGLTHVVAQGVRCEVPQRAHGLDHVAVNVGSSVATTAVPRHG